MNESLVCGGSSGVAWLHGARGFTASSARITNVARLRKVGSSVAGIQTIPTVDCST